MATYQMGGTASENTTTAHIMNGTTAIDCQKQVRSWRLVRSYMELLIPNCGCYSTCTSPGRDDQMYYCKEEEEEEEEDEDEEEGRRRDYKQYSKTSSAVTSTHINISKQYYVDVELPTIVTGTIFGFRHGKVSLCIQPNHRSAPIVLLGLAVPSSVLSREMQSGLLQIALEYCNINNKNNNIKAMPLMSMPLWTVYCNGRKAGFAVKRRPTRSDVEVLRLMRSVVVGAGSINRDLLVYEDDELIYLRANFERVKTGFQDSVSFRLIDPDGTTGQELSIFFLRS